MTPETSGIVPGGIGFARRGREVQIWPTAKIVGAERIHLGNRIIIDDFVLIIAGPRLVIGDFVHIGSHTSIVGGSDFEIGDFAGLSGGVRIYTGNEDYSGGSLTNPTVPLEFRQVTRAPVRIARHAIVGANAVVLPGVTIGEGAVVGAGSLVTRDCAPWSVNMGVPAKVIGRRPSETMLRMEQELRSKYYGPGGELLSPTPARAPTEAQP